MYKGTNIKGGCAVSTTIWIKLLDDEWGYAYGLDGVPPSGGAMDHGDDNEMWVRRRVGVSSDRGGDGRRGDTPIILYIKRRLTNISEKVACRPVYTLFIEAEWMPGTSQLVRCWNQDVVN